MAARRYAFMYTRLLLLYYYIDANALESISNRHYRQYFQYALFIPIVGVSGDLPR